MVSGCPLLGLLHMLLLLPGDAPFGSSHDLTLCYSELKLLETNDILAENSFLTVSNMANMIWYLVICYFVSLFPQGHRRRQGLWEQELCLQIFSPSLLLVLFLSFFNLLLLFVCFCFFFFGMPVTWGSSWAWDQTRVIAVTQGNSCFSFSYWCLVKHKVFKFDEV